MIILKYFTQVLQINCKEIIWHHLIALGAQYQIERTRYIAIHRAIAVYRKRCVFVFCAGNAGSSAWCRAKTCFRALVVYRRCYVLVLCKSFYIINIPYVFYPPVLIIYVSYNIYDATILIDMLQIFSFSAYRKYPQQNYQ